MQQLLGFSNVTFADQSRSSFPISYSRWFKKSHYTVSFLKFTSTASSMILWTQYHNVHNTSFIQSILQELARLNIRFRLNKTSEYHYCINDSIFCTTKPHEACYCTSVLVSVSACTTTHLVFTTRFPMDRFTKIALSPLISFPRM